MHGFPGTDTIVEEDGHIGHGAVLHGCIVQRNALVGMNAVVNDNAVIGESAMVAAMAFVKARLRRAAAHARRRRSGAARAHADRTGARLEGRGNAKLPGARAAQRRHDEGDDAAAAPEANRKRIDVGELLPLSVCSSAGKR